MNLKNLTPLLGKMKTRSQMCRVLTEDGRIELRELVVHAKDIRSDEAMASWLIDADNQVKDEDTKAWLQVITERSCAPLDLFVKRDYHRDKADQSGRTVLWDIIKAIFHENWTVTLLNMHQKENRDKFIMTATYILGFVIAATPVIAIIKIWVIK